MGVTAGARLRAGRIMKVTSRAPKTGGAGERESRGVVASLVRWPPLSVGEMTEAIRQKKAMGVVHIAPPLRREEWP